MNASDRDADNLFFTLPPRTMAKLFRPKRPLCGKPMTISVGGTVFCCHAVLVDQSRNTSGLVLFSIIVALTSSIHTSAIPISGWYDPEEYDPSSISGAHAAPLQQQNSTGSIPETTMLKASTSFLAVRKVHVTLARICRALEREEHRCRYVGVQAAMLRKIESEYKASMERTQSTNSSATTAKSEIGKRRHRRVTSATSIAGSTIVTEMPGDQDSGRIRALETKERQQRDQDVTDLQLAARGDDPQIHGNLARELLQVFHALSHTDEASAPTSAAVLSARDSTVFINRHIAVPVESVAQKLAQDAIPVVKPFHTLLFPKASPSTLANGIISPSSKIKHFLSILDPKKSLSEIAHESAIALDSVMEMATYLVANHICVVSYVFHHKCVLACCRYSVTRMDGLSLAFSQTFHQLPIQGIVGLLTTGWTIEELVEKLSAGQISEVSCGDALQALVDEILEARQEEERRLRQKAQDDQERLLRKQLAQSMGLDAGNIPHDQQQSVDESPSRFLVAFSALESLVFQMATWLGAHSVVVPMKEFLVAGTFSSDATIKESELPASSSSSFPHRNLEFQFSFEDTVFKELLEVGCLQGRVSSDSVRWQFSLDERTFERLKVWGRQTGRLRCVLRVPNEEDEDWTPSSIGAG